MESLSDWEDGYHSKPYVLGGIGGDHAKMRTLLA